MFYFSSFSSIHQLVPSLVSHSKEDFKIKKFKIKFLDYISDQIEENQLEYHWPTLSFLQISFSLFFSPVSPPLHLSYVVLSLCFRKLNNPWPFMGGIDPYNRPLSLSQIRKSSKNFGTNSSLCDDLLLWRKILMFTMNLIGCAWYSPKVWHTVNGEK